MYPLLVLIIANLASLSLSVSWSILCLALSLMLASLTLFWSSLSLLLEVLVYDLCFFFYLIAVDSPILDPLFSATRLFLLKRSHFSSAVYLTLLACLYLLWASLWSALLCSSVWHSILLSWGEVSIGTVLAFSVAMIINFAELAHFEMWPYVCLPLCACSDVLTLYSLK